MPESEPAWQKYKDRVWDARNQRGKYDAQMYAAMIEMADRQIGEILDLLKKLGIDKNTVLVICGDNGGQPYFQNERHPHGFLAPNLDPRTGLRFRGGKGSFYEGGLRIPFIVRWPGKIESGSVSDHLGYFPDIMPTLAELAGIDLRVETDGISIVPTLLGEEVAGRSQRRHEYLYWEDGRSTAIRAGNWKAIRSAESTVFELYDLEKDPEEKHDVAPEHPGKLKKLLDLAAQSHRPPRQGNVLDSSAGFKGHRN
jgi:arylsulfatase A-like enzyme